MKVVFFMFLLWGFFLQAFTLLLINDTPFFLTAVVQGNNGITITTEAVKPKERKKVEIDISRGQLSSPKNPSYTPMNVFWRCPNGGLSGVVSNVMPATWVFASSSVGQRSCEVQQQQ